MSIFLKIFAFFSHLFAGAKKTWQHVEPEVQNAMLHSTGIVDVINKNITQTPQFILELIKKQFPQLPVEKIEAMLKKAAVELKLVDDSLNPDALTTLEAIQKYLASHNGTGWALASDGVAKVIAVFLAPAGTKATTIISLLWWVYQTFIKK